MHQQRVAHTEFDLDYLILYQFSDWNLRTEGKNEKVVHLFHDGPYGCIVWLRW
jgi:hypothetical protein